MKKILVYLIILFVFSNNIIIAQTVYSEDKADAVYTNILHEFILNPDNSALYNYEHQLLLKSSFSFFRQYGESFVVYNSQLQKLKIKKSETTMKDGTKVKSPVNAYNEVLPKFAENAASYMNFKEMVVTHTGLESGASIDFAYSIESSKEFFPGLLAKVVTGNRCPVRKMTVRVLVPKGMVLQYAVLNTAVNVQKRTVSNFDVYTWEFSNLPMIEVEPNQPSFDEISPVVAFSTLDKENLYNHIVAKSNNYNVSSLLKEQINIITEKCKTNLEKMEAMCNYVKKNIATIDVDLSWLGYQAQSPEITFFKKAGTFLDKAILLQWMTKTAGIQVTPVLISDFNLLPAAQNFLPFYNNCLLKIEGEEGFVDFTQIQNTEKPSYLFKRNGLQLQHDFAILKIEMPQNAKVVAEIKLTINQDEMFSGNVNFKTSGILLYEKNSKGLEALIKKMFAEGKYKIKTDENGMVVDKAKVMSTAMNATIEGKTNKEATNTIFTLDLPGSAGYIENLQLSINSIQRTSPVSFAFPIEEELKYEIQIPEKWQVFGKLADVSIKNEVGAVKISLQQKGNVITVLRSIKLDTNFVDVSQYAKLQELLVAWAKADGKKLHFVLK